MNPALGCPKYPNRRRYSSMFTAMEAADRHGPDVEVRRCEERHGGCGGWHLPEGLGPIHYERAGCPTPEKERFITEWEAEDRLAVLQRRYPEAIHQRVYPCSFTEGTVANPRWHFHLTSQPEELC